jgi:hypothetical protein
MNKEYKKIHLMQKKESTIPKMLKKLKKAAKKKTELRMWKRPNLSSIELLDWTTRCLAV